jgi:hypothetical protein
MPGMDDRVTMSVTQSISGSEVMRDSFKMAE